MAPNERKQTCTSVFYIYVINLFTFVLQGDCKQLMDRPVYIDTTPKTILSMVS